MFASQSTGATCHDEAHIWKLVKFLSRVGPNGRAAEPASTFAIRISTRLKWPQQVFGQMIRATGLVRSARGEGGCGSRMVSEQSQG